MMAHNPLHRSGRASFPQSKKSTSPSDRSLSAARWITLTLTEHEGKTTLNLRVGPINATEEECNIFQGFREAMQKGLGGTFGTFDQLDEYLAKA